MLRAKQKKCIELMLTGEYTQREISRLIKVSEQTICSWKKNEEFVKEYSDCVRSSIQFISGKALKSLINLLDARSEMARFMAAKDVLDRAGYKPEDKIDLNASIPIVISGGDNLED